MDPQLQHEFRGLALSPNDIEEVNHIGRKRGLAATAAEAKRRERSFRKCPAGQGHAIDRYCAAGEDV